jgi:hypothetical protein
MTRRPGRPPLDPADPSVQVCIRFPAKRYDALYKAASASRTTVPDLIRRTLARVLRNPNSAARVPRP